MFILIRNFSCFSLLIAFCLMISCGGENRVNSRLNDEMPPKILWAWERPEDLRFLDSEKFGVAFLAQTLTLRNGEVVFRPRRQPLEVEPRVYLIAVTRIETERSKADGPAFSAEQRSEVVNLVKKTLELPHVRAVQIDFDAVVSERDFYRALMRDLKKELPEKTPLTMTALASWCIGDAWFNDFPVDEAVPMAFVMGADEERVRDFLSRGNDWREPLCRGSYGLSVDEPLKADLKPNRRFYYFKSKAWNRADLERIK
ncbi:MAG: hypothetical protein R2747_09280 [Pyrinomonadaceae bacterium]